MRMPAFNKNGKFVRNVFAMREQDQWPEHVEFIKRIAEKTS